MKTTKYLLTVNCLMVIGLILTACSARLGNSSADGQVIPKIDTTSLQFPLKAIDRPINDLYEIKPHTKQNTFTQTQPNTLDIHND